MSLKTLLKDARNCSVCKEFLPYVPRPILSADSRAKILIIGQAPGKKVNRTGIPWNDPSGDRLRDWLGLSHEEFYDVKKIAMIPMGFCYPGTGRSGDLPPREECAPLWHEKIISKMPHVKLILLLSQYSQRFYLGERQKETLTKTVRAWKVYAPKYIPLPHPSPRNNIWLKKNPWFKRQLLPYLKRRVRKALSK